MIGRIVTLIILILFSAYFSGTETSYLSFNRIRIKNLAANGDRRAKLVMTQSSDFDRLISTILIGNNIVNIAASAIATVLFVSLVGNEIGPTVATAVMTILVLIFGEITPKSVAKQIPESVVLKTAPVMRVLLAVLYPLNFVFYHLQKWLLSLLPIKKNPSITEEELLTIVDEAATEGNIDEQESELIRSAIEFTEQEARAILVPRVDVSAVPKGASVGEIQETFAATGYSRLPVYENNIDHIVGIIHHKDLYNRVIHRGESLSSIIMEVPFISPTMKVSRLLRMLQKEKSHFAVVTDEYGGTLGIITLEDVLEELVGEIWDEHDNVIEDIRKVGDNLYRVLGTADLDTVFDLGTLKNEEEHSINAAGWVTEQLDRIPLQGDSFRYRNLEVTVTKVDSRRILEIMVSVLGSPDDFPE